MILRRVTARTVQEYKDMYLHGAHGGGGAGLLRSMKLIREMRDRANIAHVNFKVVIYPLLYKDLFGHYHSSKYTIRS